MTDPVERGIRKAISHCLTLAKDPGPPDFEDIRWVMLSMLYGYLDGRADAKEAGESPAKQSDPQPESIRVVITPQATLVHLIWDSLPTYRIWFDREELQSIASHSNIVHLAIDNYLKGRCWYKVEKEEKLRKAWRKVPVTVGAAGWESDE